MFGYIIINKAELKFKEFDEYHAYYCGLCQVLKKKYGAIGQMTLSYDMTFLLMLLSSLYEPQKQKGSCKCIAHPFEKHDYQTNRFTEYIADMNVLLTVYKCRDDWADEKKLTKHLFGKLLEGKSQQLKRLYTQKINKIANAMEQLSEAEKKDVTDIDVMSGLFGDIMAQIAVYKEDEWSDNLKRFGFYLGKFIYLLDAYEDIEEDIKKKTYNPFKRIYQRPDFEEECKTILTMMMAECCKEFEKLPILEDVGILRNILYSGVWTRYEIVHDKRTKKGEEEGTLNNV